MKQLADRPTSGGKTRPSGANAGEATSSPRPIPMSRMERVVRRSNLKLVLMTIDALTIMMGVLAAVIVRQLLGNDLNFREQQYMALAFAATPLWIAVLSANKLYAARFITRSLEEFRRIFRSSLVATVVMSAAAFMLKMQPARGWVLLLSIFSTLFLCIERAVIRKAFGRMRHHGMLMRPVIVVGGNLEGLELCHMLEDEPQLGYEVRGFVDDEGPAGDTRHPHRGTLEETIKAVKATGSTGVIIAATTMDLGTSNKLIRQLTDHGIHVELSSTLRDIAAHRLTVRPLGRYPVVYVEPVQLDGWRSVAKRGLDIFLAGVGLVLASPVLAAAAVAIKLDSRGPILFQQERVGRHGARFKVLKLRSMVVNAEDLLIDLSEKNEADGPLFKMKNDPRVTRVGAITRKFSIDEIPQLWNVLKGEMSMVGPRPALPDEVRFWGEQLHNRLRVKPGITGMWQVSGRSESTFAEYERLDLYYVDNWSLATDLAIVLKTIPAVLMRKGAF